MIESDILCLVSFILLCIVNSLFYYKITTILNTEIQRQKEVLDELWKELKISDEKFKYVLGEIFNNNGTK